MWFTPFTPNRSVKPPALWESSSNTTNVVVVHKANEKDKNMSVLGFGGPLTVMTIHDGSTDSFASMPDAIKKTFPDTASIRKFMSVNASSKVFALVIENFERKGTFEYELSNVRHRSGYGKCDIKHIPPAKTGAAEINKFFGQTGVTASPASTVPESTTKMPDAADATTVDQGQAGNAEAKSVAAASEITSGNMLQHATASQEQPPPCDKTNNIEHILQDPKPETSNPNPAEQEEPAHRNADSEATEQKAKASRPTQAEHAQTLPQPQQPECEKKENPDQPPTTAPASDGNQQHPPTESFESLQAEHPGEKSDAWNLLS